MNEHGYCPNCGIDLDGELIFETLLKQYNDREKALETANLWYGATETTGRWGKQIGIYDAHKDRTVSWLCPECNHEWER